MNRNFLLTYQHNGHTDFAWFATEEEMRDAIIRCDIEEKDIFEMVEVERVREIEL